MLAGISAAVIGVILNLAVLLAGSCPKALPRGWPGPNGPSSVALMLVLAFRLGMLDLVGFGIGAGLGPHVLGRLRPAATMPRGRAGASARATAS